MQNEIESGPGPTRLHHEQRGAAKPLVPASRDGIGGRPAIREAMKPSMAGLSPRLPKAQLNQASPSPTRRNDTLDTSSKSRQSSLAGLAPNALHEDVLKALSHFLQHSQKLSILRENVLSLRTRTKVVVSEYTNHLEFVRDSQQEFSKESEVMLTLDPANAHLERLRSLHALVSADHERQASRAQAVRDMENQLVLLEAKMKNAEEKLQRDVQAASGLLLLMGVRDDFASTTGNESPVSSSRSDSAETKLPPIVAHYLDKVGDMKIERDKLLDLDHEYRNEKTDRQLLQDQGHSPNLSDGAFEDSWLQRFAEAEVEYAKASERMELAREVCTSENINLDAYYNRRSVSSREDLGTPSLVQTPVITPSAVPPSNTHFDDMPLSMAQIALQPSSQLSAENEPRTDAFTSPTTQEEHEHTNHLERVAHWIIGIDDKQPVTLEVSNELNPLFTEGRDNYMLPLQQAYESRGVITGGLDQLGPERTALATPYISSTSRMRSISDTSPLPSVSGEFAERARGRDVPAAAGHELVTPTFHTTGRVLGERERNHRALKPRSKSEPHLSIMASQAGMSHA